MSDVEPAAGTAALSAPLPPGARHHVVAIGSAIVDVIAHADDAFVAEHGLEKGTMSHVFSEGAGSQGQSRGKDRQLPVHGERPSTRDGGTGRLLQGRRGRQNG
jgi:hypothetical protein